MRIIALASVAAIVALVLSACGSDPIGIAGGEDGGTHDASTGKTGTGSGGGTGAGTGTDPSTGDDDDGGSSTGTGTGTGTTPGDDSGAGTGGDDDDDDDASAPPHPDAGGTPHGTTYKGQATYYDAEGVGSCGKDISASVPYAAMNSGQYSKSVCGKCAKVTGPDGSVVVQIEDLCPGCHADSLDLNETAFQEIASLSAGRVSISWYYTDCN